MSGLAGEMVLLGTSLLTLFNPPSAMAAFATLASPYPRDVQNRMARRTAVFYAAAILLVTWAGRPLLERAGPVFAGAAGGGRLRAAAGGDAHGHPVPAQRRAEGSRARGRRRAKSRSWVQLVAVPLTFPISIGGATVAAVIAADRETSPSLDARDRHLGRLSRDDRRRLADARLGHPADAPDLARVDGGAHRLLRAAAAVHRLPGDRGRSARSAARAQPSLTTPPLGHPNATMSE